MKKVSNEVIQEAHRYLEWDFHQHKLRGEGGKEDNVWNKQRVLVERYIKYKIQVLTSKEMDSQAVVGEVQQLLRRENPFCINQGLMFKKSCFFWYWSKPILQPTQLFSWDLPNISLLINVNGFNWKG